MQLKHSWAWLLLGQLFLGDFPWWLVDSLWDVDVSRKQHKSMQRPASNQDLSAGQCTITPSQTLNLKKSFCLVLLASIIQQISLSEETLDK